MSTPSSQLEGQSPPPTAPPQTASDNATTGSDVAGPLKVQVNGLGGVGGGGSSNTADDADADDESEMDLETPKASMFLSRVGLEQGSNGSSSTTAVQTNTQLSPQSSSGGNTPSRPVEGLSRVNSDLSIREDYFHAPPSGGLTSLLPKRVGLKPSYSSMRAQNQKHQAQAHSAATGLQSQPTTAISLPEGVYAQQQDGDMGPSASRTTSIAGAPSFISHIAPTLDGRGNDVEGMLGEILSMEDGDHGWWGSETGAAGWNAEMSAGDMDADELEESSDEERDKEMSEEALIARWRSRKKHYFVLSSAGKPIYTRHGDEKLISGYMGVIQTIVSFFQDNGETLRSFVAGKHHFVVVKEGPLYLVAISSLGESDGQLRAQLDALYNQVISTLTVPSLSKVFAQREGYDLRRLLGGTEVFLDGLSDAMTRGDPATLLSSLECIKLRKSHREKINAALLKFRVPTLLYGLIIADGRLVSVVRPKRHSLYPPDLQLLFSMLFNAYTFRDGGEHWIPICLPKFNSRGYLHAYICFFRPEIAIVLISAEKDTFFELRTMKEKVVEHLDAQGLTPLIEASLQSNRYSVTDILTPDQKVLHFLYKSRANVQFTMPAYEPHFYTPLARRRLLTVYQRLHAAVHAKQGGYLKVHYARGEGWSTLAWVTGTWELYVVAGGGVERKALAEAAGRVVRWVDREEERCFVVGGAVF